MISCDYNGWADLPEDQREELEAFDAPVPPPAVNSITSRRSFPVVPQRKAA
jgi:hypothetical protein